MNRIRQFIWAINAKFKPIDEAYLKKYLSKEEFDLFNKLNVSEKHHCIRVCKDSIDYINNSSNIQDIISITKMAKVALLHDIGKINKSLNVLDKCMLVILDKITRGRLKKINNTKVDIYYNHGKKSYDLLKSIGCYDDEVLQAVEMHHSKRTYKNIYLQILKEMDDKN